MIKAVIIEDEEIAAIRLQNLIQEIDGSIVITRHISSAKKAIAYLSDNIPDLIFLDIHLSDSNSFEIFKQVDIQTPIIFTTAYSEYAIKAFEQNSIDYLLKPISKEALTQAIEKYKRLGKIHLPDYNTIFSSELPAYKKRFLIKMNNALHTVTIEDVAYFFSEDKVTFIKLKDNRTIPMEGTLSALEKQLNPKDFFRINRKYLIGIHSIKRMYYASKSKIQVNLEPDPKEANIMVSVERLGRFKKWLSL